MSNSLAVTKRVYLSPPSMSELERNALLNAFDSGWVAPAGPDLNRFEKSFASWLGLPHAIAVSSGTAALHLSLLAVGVKPGDEVITASLTFVATANAIRYSGAVPVFVDSERSSWNMDPTLLDEAISARKLLGKRVKAVIAVNIMGGSADYKSIREICEKHGTILIEDAAESLGTSYRGVKTGAIGDIGCISFNGNKIITTSGGGMVVTSNKAWATHVRLLATQAREPAVHFEHRELGFNYRLSNLLAAVGNAQLSRLDEMVYRKREIFQRYFDHLSDIPGIRFIEAIPNCISNCWLTCFTLDDSIQFVSNDDIINALEEQNIESRPVWKPMHLQPLYQDSPIYGGEVAEELYRTGVCLPSGVSMTNEDQDRVIRCVRFTCNASHTHTTLKK